MPISGFTRFRQWAFSAAQSAHGTAATPSGAFPWRGTPNINPNWTDLDDVDDGSIDVTLQPYRKQLDTTVTLAGPADFNSLPEVMNMGVRGGVAPTGGGAAKTWTHTALSLTATTLDEASAQWGDDYGSDDMRFKDGVIESIEITFPEDLGPATISTQWYFGSVDSGVTKVASLVLPSNLPLIFGADTALYIDSTAGAIGGTQISNSLHSGSIKITNTIDKKRFMNGSNSRFAVAGYGLAERSVEATFTFAKIDSIAGSTGSEIVKWLNSTAVSRFLQLKTTSTEIITGSTPYSWTQNFSGDWRQRTDGELGGNSTITLMLKGRYNGDLGYIYQSVVVNSNAALP